MRNDMRHDGAICGHFLALAGRHEQQTIKIQRKRQSARRSGQPGLPHVSFFFLMRLFSFFSLFFLVFFYSATTANKKKHNGPPVTLSVK